ncbi:MAG: EAL domain-containing protein [Cyanobacteria bacterium P01_F01_bin.42]
MRHLFLIRDSSGVRSIQLESSSYFLGRDAKNSIVLSGQSISRHHAILLRISGADPSQFSYILTDGNLQGKRSKNGTKVNQKTFVSTRLQSGDLVQFGNEVFAKYLKLEAMTAQDFKLFCKNAEFDFYYKNLEQDVELGGLFSDTQKVLNLRETKMIGFEPPPEKEDLFLVRLATFPEIFPIPMFEITVRGQLTYLNPAAHASFPDLSEMGMAHPALDGLAHQITSSNKKVLSREVEIQGCWYEQSIHYIAENGLIRCCLLDVTPRKNAEEALRRRDQLSKSVAEVTTHLLTGLHQDSVIDVALEMFGSSIGVDRVCISENVTSEEQLATSLKYEWVKPGMASILRQPHRQGQAYQNSYLQRWYPLLAEDGMICAFRKDMPDEERSVLFRDGIRSLLVVPVNVNNSFWGFLELDHCVEEYEWTPNDVANVRALAASIGAAIQRQRQEQVIQHQAFHDALTGLPNRALFHEKLDCSLLQAQEQNLRVAVMFLDLDKFKVVNDTLGHSVGDGLLQEVGQRLRDCVRSTDMVARWGGDEFIILLPDINTLDDAIGTAKRILAAFQQGCQIEGHDLTINTSIGIAIYPNDALEAEVLVRNADIALYQSKEMGRGTYNLYNAGVDLDSTEIFSLRESLKKGVADNNFVLFYQPQISLTTNRIASMETLVRWNHPKFGLVSPNQFLPVASELGIMQDLGDWILESAVQQCVEWYRMGFEQARVSINLSEVQFNHPDLVNRIHSVLERFSCPPECIQIEVSETIAFGNVHLTQRIFNELVELGLSIVIDDFGAGTASLNDFTKLPVKGVKLHRDLIQTVQSDRNSAAIVRALLSLARFLGVTVAAVGIDNADKISYMKSLSCDFIQGYIIAPPLPAEEASLKLRGEFHLPVSTISRLIHS